MFKPLGEVRRNTLEPISKLSCERLVAKICAFAVVSAYRSADVDDPEGYVTNAIAVLTRYPEAVVKEVCEPGVGIQTRIKWPPTQSELRDACERVAGEHAARERRYLLAKHGVLIDTPQGLRPEIESGKPTVEARERAVAYWTNEVRPTMQSASAAKTGLLPGLTEDQQREWYGKRLEGLKGQPLPKLSDAAKRAAGISAIQPEKAGVAK